MPKWTKELAMVLSFFANPMSPQLVAESFHQLSIREYHSLRNPIKGILKYMQVVRMKDGALARDEAIAWLIQRGHLEANVSGQLTLRDEYRSEVLSNMPEKDQKHWIMYAHAAVNALLPNPADIDWGLLSGLRPHVDSCLGHVDRLGLRVMETVDVAMTMVGYFSAVQRWSDAELYCREALRISESLEKREEEAIALIVMALADVLRKQRKFDGVEDLVLQAQRILKRLHGEDNAEYAISVHNLGALKSDIGDLESAASLLAEAGRVLDRDLSWNDPILAEVYEDQAILHIRRGDPRAAESCRAKAAKIREASSNDPLGTAGMPASNEQS